MKDLIKRLSGDNEGDRIYAVQDIMEANDPGQVILLLNRLPTEKSPMVRDAVLFALKQMPCREIYGMLFELLRSPDAWIRNAAVTIFGSEGQEAVEFLSSHIHGSDREIRKLISDALFLIGTPEVLPVIRAALKDSAVNVKITAVEYLGRLDDKDSATDLMRLFQTETEPMLRMAILDALSLIGSENDIIRLLSAIGADKNMSDIDPLYIPAAIRLSAKSGKPGVMCRIIESVDTAVYADDIVRAVGGTKDILTSEPVVEKIFEIVENKDIDDNTRNAAVEILLSNNINKDRLSELGKILIEEEKMRYVGIRIIAFSKTSEGMEKIREILSNTKDEEIRELCEELLDEAGG